MRLTQKEQERLMFFSLAELSRRRYLRGVKLNYIEAAAIICDELLEQARSGGCTIDDLTALGSKIISLDAVKLLPVLQLEVQFPDGNKLITIHNPIRLTHKAETAQNLLSFYGFKL